jgi:microcystin degradation protein MlrC
MAWEMREEFYGEYPSPSDAVAEAVNRAADRDEDDSPVLLVEAGDVVGGGSPGDVTAVLRELIDAGIDNAGFASIWDPETVQYCIDAGVGARVDIPALGGKAIDGLSEPLEDLDARVKAITDGEFVNTGPMATGSRNHLGPTALIQCGSDEGTEVIVTSNRQQPIDAEIWRHIGIQPERKSVLAIKSVNHFRADYEQFVNPVDILTVDGPGLTPIDTLRMLDFQRLRRPIYPLDKDATYDPS